MNILQLENHRKMNGQSIKQQFKNVIIESINEHKYNLNQVKDALKKKFQKSLSNYDEIFCEQKYMKVCSDAWLKETADYLENKTWDSLQDMFSTINKSNSLVNIPEDFKQLDFYKLLLQHCNLLGHGMESNLISRFKKYYLEIMRSMNCSEFTFIEALFDFLKSKNLKTIVRDLRLAEFCSNKSSINALLERLRRLDTNDYGKTLVKLLNTARSLQPGKSLLLFDTLPQMVEEYLKPTKITKRQIDGRLVLEATGANIVMSEILGDMEEIIIINGQIDEVRFVGTFVIHIDMNIEKGIWHGMNVVVLTKNLRIHGTVTWDVSGDGNAHVYEENAGTGEDGDGKPGKDGLPGESGGNVLFLYDAVENYENFIVISNGGKGSKGQDGGDGDIGKNGEGISRKTLEDMMPPPTNVLAHARIVQLKHVLKSIKDIAVSYETLWSRPEVSPNSIDAIFQRVEYVHEVLSRPDINYKHIINAMNLVTDVFLEGTIEDGSKVTFSYYGGKAFVDFQAFLLYKGQLGRPGGVGGMHGLGGQGGYAGEIVFNGIQDNIPLRVLLGVAKDGANGENGKGGIFGSQGRNGWDMGRTDYWLTPQFYGSYSESTIRLNYYSDSAPTRFWCPYKNKYAEMSAAIVEHDNEKIYSGRRSTRDSNERQHYANALKKKNISVTGVLANYGDHLSSMESETLQNLQLNIHINQLKVSQAIRDIDKGQEKLSTELRVQRHVKLSDSTKQRAPKIITLVDGEAIHVDVQETPCEHLLFNRYKFVKLQRLARHLRLPEASDTIDVPKENYERYLVEGVNSHPIFDSQSEFISRSDVLQISLKGFILEVGRTEGVHPIIKVIYDKWLVFDRAKKDILSGILTKLHSEIVQQKDNDLYALFIESLKNKNKMDAFEEKIEKIKGLKDIYSQFKIEATSEFPWMRWDMLLLKNELTNYVKEKGLLSRCCRESLALAHETNVRIYADDQSNGLHLIDNHNPQSKVKLHILYGANKFTQLKFNNDYLKLDTQRKNENTYYGKILDIFYNNQNLDDYMKNVEVTARDVFGCKKFIDEKEIIQKIGRFFPEQCHKVTQLLEMISNNVGGKEILSFILLRFSGEGKCISYLELSCLINSVVASVIEDRKMQNIFCWIIVAHSQQNWIDELTLLRLENYFRCVLEEKSLWREYLSKITNKTIVVLIGSMLPRATSLSIQCVEETLFLLSSIPDESVSLEGLELSEWPYVLKETFWLNKLKGLTNWRCSENLPVASYYLMSMDNTFGSDLVDKLLMTLMKGKKLSSFDLMTILSNFYHEKWNLSDKELETFCFSHRKWIKKMNKKFSPDGEVRNLDVLAKQIQSNENTSRVIANELPNVSVLIKGICCDDHVIKGKRLRDFSFKDIVDWAKDKKASLVEPKKENIIEILAVLVRGIQLLKNVNLRDTQLLTVAALLTNSRSTLAQVATGEGKSLIVVATSIIKALLGEQVDVITSSSVLAKRDAEENKDIYNLFCINVSHNCSEDIEKRKEAYSNNDVVYGDLTYFQRDYLLDRFYGKNVLGDRNFSNIIVDEVDSMLLDKGNNMLYLSHDLAGLDKLESLYIFIWQWINQPVADIGAARYAFNVAAIKDAALRDMYGLVKLDDLNKLGWGINHVQKTTIWEQLVKEGFINLNGTLKNDSVNFNKLSKIVSSKELVCYKDRLKFLFREIVGREKRIHVPKSLRSFVESHLDCWIRSAVNAYFMKPGQDYVVDVNRSGTSSDRDANITILDRDTGTDQANSQWEEGLHQFLQLKHGCRLSLQSLKAVFISNVSFFKLYKHLYGLTGTLGSRIERDILRNVYNVDFVTIPTALVKQFREDEPINCVSYQHWIQEICERATTLTVEHKRSVLIICDTIDAVHVLAKKFSQNNIPFHKYVRDYEVLEIAKGDKRLQCGEIIIATNLAGRGTDIKISDALRKAGGLHVLLTYLPTNIRIEQQAFGRTARNGDNGSGQLIVVDPSGQQFSSLLRLINLKKKRNDEEIHRLSEIKTYYETQTVMEENCFKAFREQYERLKTKLSEDQVPKEVSEILLQSCLDKWAFWLDENSKHMNNAVDNQSKKSIECYLNKFKQEFQHFSTGFEKNGLLGYVGVTEYNSYAWVPWVAGNPTQMVKLATCLTQNGTYLNGKTCALELFDEVISCEPFHCEASRYYKSYALAKGINWDRKPLSKADSESLAVLKNELHAVSKMFNDRANFFVIASGIIGTIKQNSVNSIIQVDSYEKQKKNLASFYNIFLQSLDDICGRALSPQSFLNDETRLGCAEILFNDLLEKGIIDKPRVNKNISKGALVTVCNGYGISNRKLTTFLSNYDKIDESIFKKELKKQFKLPGREAFWKILLSHKVLTDEIKYVVVDTERLREVEPREFEFFCHQRDEKLFTDQSLTLNEGYAILYYEWLTSDGRSKYKNIYEERYLIKGLGRCSYEILKKRHCLLFNKVAKFFHKDFNSIVLPHDSITLNDIIQKLGVVETDAELIINRLVSQNVIKARSNTSFTLNINADSCEQIQFPSFPVYEKSIQGLLTTCFSYTIALKKMVEQCLEKTTPIRVPLVSKPHQRLYMDFLDEEIVIPPMAASVDVNLENKLKSMYANIMTKDELLEMLSKYYIILIEEQSWELVFNTLLKKKWITRFIPRPKFTSKLSSNFKQQSDLYVINNAELRLPLNLEILQGTVKYPFDRPIEAILDRRLHLQRDESIIHIMNILKKHVSSLNTSKVPESKLKSLVDTFTHGQFNFENTLELHLFHLNGLDQLLQFGEKRWTREMIGKTAIDISLGVVEIAIGASIDLLWLRTRTELGAALINEGFRDIFLAAGDIYSGYYSPKDSWQHKYRRLMEAAWISCLSYALSNGAEWLGCSLSGPQFQDTGKDNSELSCKPGVKSAATHVLKSITEKAVEGLTLGATCAVFETLVDNHMRDLCEIIGSSLLIDINSHEITVTLKEAWRVFGIKEARQIINKLTRIAFSEQRDFLKCDPIVKRLKTILSEGVKPVRDICMFYQMENLVLVLNNISSVATCAIFISELNSLTKIKEGALNDLDKLLKNELRDRARGRLRKEAISEEEYDKFEYEMIDVWKALLRDEIGRIIKSLLVEFADKVIGLKGIMRYSRSTGRSPADDQLQHDNTDKLRNIDSDCDEMTKARDYATMKYHEDLLKLMVKTKSAELFSKIVREGIPMDLTCVSACTLLVDRLLKNVGISNVELSIVVKGEGGVRQEFSTEAKGGVPVIILLNLIDSHFELSRGGPSANTATNNPGNNCLYEAVVSAIPQLIDAGFTAEMFRSEMSFLIESDPKMRYHIQQGWHRLPIYRDVFGIRRVVTVPTFTNINQQVESLEPNYCFCIDGWTFDKAKDIDLRTSQALTTEQIRFQRADAFNMAVYKINEKLSIIGKVSNPVTSSDFTETKEYDIRLCHDSFGQIQFVLFPVKIMATVEIEIPGETGCVPYTLQIDEDVKLKAGCHRPLGPHVRYIIERPNDNVPEGVTGHILINKVDVLTDDYSVCTESGAIPISEMFSPKVHPDTYFSIDS